MGHWVNPQWMHCYLMYSRLQVVVTLRQVQPNEQGNLLSSQRLRRGEAGPWILETSCGNMLNQPKALLVFFSCVPICPSKTHFGSSSFYTLIGVLLVLELFLANLMRKVKNMLSPMHPEATTRLRATTLHTRGSALLLYESSYILGPMFMALISLCIPTTNLLNG